MAKPKKEFYVPKKDRRLPTKLDFSRANRVPWTSKQKSLINLLTRKQKFVMEDFVELDVDVLEPVDTKCAFIQGMAGVSKTFVAVYSALQLLDRGSVEKIIYVRSAVGSSPNKLGFLKGSLEEKSVVFKSPLSDKLQEILPLDQVKLLEDGEFVSMETTEYLRGRSLANCVLIADESQNYTWDELVTITSRMAEKSRIWFCYDPKQSDLNRNHKNDMVKFAGVFNGDDLENKLNGIVHFEFTKEDIVRSGFCKYVLEKLEEYEESQKKDHSLLRLTSTSSTPPCEVEEWSPS